MVLYQNTNSNSSINDKIITAVWAGYEYAILVPGVSGASGTVTYPYINYAYKLTGGDSGSGILPSAGNYTVDIQQINSVNVCGPTAITGASGIAHLFENAGSANLTVDAGSVNLTGQLIHHVSDGETIVSVAAVNYDPRPFDSATALATISGATVQQFAYNLPEKPALMLTARRAYPCPAYVASGSVSSMPAVWLTIGSQDPPTTSIML